MWLSGNWGALTRGAVLSAVATPAHVCTRDLWSRGSRHSCQAQEAQVIRKDTSAGSPVCPLQGEHHVEKSPPSPPFPNPRSSAGRARIRACLFSKHPGWCQEAAHSDHKGDDGLGSNPPNSPVSPSPTSSPCSLLCNWNPPWAPRVSYNTKCWAVSGIPRVCWPWGPEAGRGAMWV